MEKKENVPISDDIQTFIVKMEPVAKGRPRFVKKTGRVYTPKKTEEATKKLSEYIYLRKRGKIPKEIESPEYPKKKIVYGVAVYCKFLCHRPKRLGKGDRVLKTTKPDIDNYVKLVLDACNDAEVWEDDSMVVEVLGQKWYCSDHEEPQVQIQINRIKICV